MKWLVVLLAMAALLGLGLWRGPALYDALIGSEEAASQDVKPEWEIAELSRLLARSAGLVTESYDEVAMASRLEAAGVTLTQAQAQGVLPLLDAHLRALRQNLIEALEAAKAGVGAAARSIYHARAAQAHGAFQRRVSQGVSPEAAQALFQSLPSMVPPLPKRAAGEGP